MGKESVETFTWRSIKENLARGISFARANDMTEGIGGTTLQSALSEALFELDSGGGDPVSNLGGSDPSLSQSEPTRSSGVKKGKIQQVQDLLRFYYGDGETKGFFDSLLEGMGQ